MGVDSEMEIIFEEGPAAAAKKAKVLEHDTGARGAVAGAQAAEDASALADGAIPCDVCGADEGAYSVMR